ncbi:hypothetical protein P879_06086 [Paragonimus westermani]|uniref:Uncharacterized protein n=1 Tax=Paragonimus westermani TaxID=34504 RepID=A0A8T0D8D1_9TREM|nr:hypothetical protein P879_06086 [Paragonimus westermani]
MGGRTCFRTSQGRALVDLSISCGINDTDWLILLGQKYGLPLLPLKIPVYLFEQVCVRLKTKSRTPYPQTQCNDVDLTEWYELDENTLPVPAWTLKPLEAHYPDLGSENAVKRFEAVRNWNKTRDRLVRILYYHCSSCVQEGLLSPDELDDLFLCELATSTLGAFTQAPAAPIHNSSSPDFAPSKATPNADLITPPIVFQRHIIDLRQFLDEPKARSYTDVLPSTPSKGDQPDLWLMAKFSALQQLVLTNCPVFHRDYLTQFCSAFKQAALLAIDGRAIKKLELLFWPQGRCPNLDTSPSTLVAGGHQQVGSVLRLVFPEPYNPQNHLARRLQCKMRIWDRAWNTVAQFGTVCPMAESHRKEVDTILSYLADTSIGSDAPMFVYSTRKTEENGEQYSAPHLADAIAAAAFIEVNYRA